MTDVLERLRAANPVAELEAPEAERLWRTLDAGMDPVSLDTGARRLPALGARLAIAVCVLGIVALVVGLAGGTGATSIAARAYAATETAGAIDHFVEISRSRPAPGAPAFGYTDVRAEVWFSGSRSHILATYYMVSAAGHRSVDHGEDAVAGGRRVNYDVESNTVYTSLLPTPGFASARSCVTLLSCGAEPTDPITTLRVLYQAGRLHDAGATVDDGRRLDVLLGRTGRPPADGTAVRILVDPTTFIPVKVVATSYGALGRSPVVRRLVTQTTTIGSYERIPLTAATSRLLAMRAHPGAHTLCALGPAHGVGLAPC